MIAATMIDQNNQYREELKMREHAGASLRQMQFGDEARPPAKLAVASRRPAPAAQPSGATSSQAQPCSAPLEGGMPLILR
eukprot:1422888-Pyramimonas_sp.AAC.1